MGLQQTTVIGHVGKPPSEIRDVSGTKVCNFSVAVTDKWKDKSSGKTREKTTWYNVSAWGGLSQIASQYVRVGAEVCVQGKVEARVYKNKAGVHVASLELKADNIVLLGGRGERNEGSASDSRTPVAKQQNDSTWGGDDDLTPEQLEQMGEQVF